MMIVVPEDIIDIIGNNTIISNSGKFLQLLYYAWIPAFAGMTADGNTGMVLAGPVIPAKAGIQAKQSTISNNV